MYSPQETCQVSLYRRMSLTPNPLPAPNPYIGPRAYGAGERLYGREREANQLANLIIAERIVLLYSPSGAGKTSLIQAALIPRLLKMKFQVLPVVRVNLDPAGTLEGSSETNRYVFSALLSLEEGVPVEQRTPPSGLARMSLMDYLAQRPRQANDAGIEVLIVDQFEEVLTLDPTDQAAKQEFFRQLGEVLAEPRRWALFSMREDFVAGLDPYVLPVPSRFNNRYRLDLLGQDAAHQAIQLPARQAGVEFEDAVVGKLVDDLRRVRVQQPDGTLAPQLGPYVEPVQLQVVCYRLWDSPRADPTRITEQDLAAFGEVNQSLVDQSLGKYYAQRVTAIASQTGAAERSIREWFDRQLITEQGMRGTVLMGQQTSDGLDNLAIRRLVDAYLVRAEQRGGATWFELAHDRLIAPIRADNAAWFAANLNLLQRQADLWQQQGRPESLLLRSNDLAQARLWAAQHEAALLPFEADFLAASREQAARALRLRRRNQVITILGVLAMLLAVLALIAFGQAAKQRDIAQQQARLARAGQLAAQSQAALQAFPLRSMLLAVEAVHATLDNEPHPAAAEEALHAALKDPHGVLLRGHTDWVNVLAFSPDGHWLATGSQDATIRLWSLGAGGPISTPLVLSGHSKSITALAFSPDGQRLATASQDGTIRLWNMQASNPAASPVVLEGHSGDVYALAFSADGRWLASGGLDETARLWDMRAANPTQPPRILSGHQGAVWTLAFSVDGHWLATGSLDKTARLWNLRAPDPATQPVVLAGHEALITTLAFSADGHWLATGSRDKTARLWNLRATDPAAQPVLLSGHTDWVNALAFSADGDWLATGSGDQTARLWNLSSADPAAYPLVLRGHELPILSLAFSADGRWLATGSVDKTARLWNMHTADPSANPLVLRGHEDQVNVLAFSTDGRWLATGSADRTARLWVIGTPDPATNPQALSGHGEQVNTLAFSPDGHWLASGSGDKANPGNDNTARLWNLNTANPAAGPLVLSGHQNWIQALAFSADGHWLASGSGDQTARLWDMRATDPAVNPLVLRGHAAWVSTLAFSPDGHWLATGSQDATARLWDLHAADPSAAPRVLSGLEDRVSALAFSADGHWLATASGYTACLWDLSTADPTTAPLILSGHADFVTGLAFSPDSRWLVTASADKTARLWDLRSANPANNPLVLSGHEDRINVLAISPDGHWLATGSDDKTARLWNLRAANPAGAPLVLAGHAKAILTLAFNADTHWLATGSEDGHIRLWNLAVADPAADPLTLTGHDGEVFALAFSPDGRWLASGGRDHIVRLWLTRLDELVGHACQSAGRNFTRAEWQLYFVGVPYRKTCPQWPGE